MISPAVAIGNFVHMLSHYDIIMIYYDPMLMAIMIYYDPIKKIPIIS